MANVARKTVKTSGEQDDLGSAPHRASPRCRFPGPARGVRPRRPPLPAAPPEDGGRAGGRTRTRAPPPEPLRYRSGDDDQGRVVAANLSEGH